MLSPRYNSHPMLISRMCFYFFLFFFWPRFQRRRYIDTHAKSMKHLTKPITWPSIRRAQHTMTINQIMELNHCQWLHQPIQKMEVSITNIAQFIFSLFIYFVLAAVLSPMQLLFFFISFSVAGRTELKCHCDICKDDNFICETDGLCFTSVELKDNEPKYSYR